MQWSGEEKPSDTFQFVTKLGEGSFGVAYKAINNQEKVEVAIKVVYIPGNEAERLKIKKELDVLKRCHHANVVTYYGFAFVRQDMWIIMEYCSGGSVLSLFAYHSPPPTPLTPLLSFAPALAPPRSVRDLMERYGKPLKEEDVAVICHDTLEGLLYLQKVGIVHNDIKASNILVTDDAVGKIADFGVSEQLNYNLAEKRGLVGSPYWMAPEAINSGRNDFRSDIWSLGITAYEMAEGLPPHANLNPGLAMRVIPHSQAPTLPEKKYSKQFADFITKALDLDPSKRWTADRLLAHPFVKKPKRDKLRKLIKDAPSEYVAPPIATQVPSFSGFDGATPVWEGGPESVPSGNAQSIRYFRSFVVSHRKSTLRSLRDLRSIGVQTEPVGCWDAFTMMITSCFQPTPPPQEFYSYSHSRPGRKPTRKNTKSSKGSKGTFRTPNELKDDDQEEGGEEGDAGDTGSVIEHQYQASENDSLLRKK